MIDFMVMFKLFCIPIVFFFLLACDDAVVAINDEPQYEAWFNYPEVDPNNPGRVQVKDFEPEVNLKKLIQQADYNSTIHISLYLFTRPIMAEALKKVALERNVKIFLVVEDGWRAITELQKEIVSDLENFKTDNSENPIRVFRCKKGCNGRLINHNKFFLFSSAAGFDHIVVQSSANLSEGTGVFFENSVVIKGDYELYYAYLNYWNDLSKRKKDLAYFRSFPPDGLSADRKVKAFFLPQKKGDVIADILDNMSCEEEGRLRLTTSNWDSRRKLDLQLIELARQGCDIEVLVPDNPKKTHCDVRVNLHKSIRLLTAYKLPHSKYIIFEGIYKGQKRRIVWTGSHNYHIHSLRSSDEVLLEISVKKIVDDFVENWARIIQYGSLERGLDADNPESNKCFQVFLEMEARSN